jgi:aminoglycoside phosphotransferase (APT) family kinase protein
MKSTTTTVTFANQPTMAPHEIAQKDNARRLSLIPHIESFVANHLSFKNHEVKVTFFEKGVSSLVCLLESGTTKMVLKIPLSSHPLYENDTIFLREWEKVGVKVPHVFEEGYIDGSHYVLMEFVDAPTLEKAYTEGKLIDEGILRKMGATLRMMHNAKSRGFGVLIDGKGKYEHFSEWLDSEISWAESIMKDSSLISEFSEQISAARKIMSEFVGTSTDSCYGHNDFIYPNIFATDPLTVFDPAPILVHPYMDLARTVVLAIGRGVREEAADELVGGYCGDDMKLDLPAFQAALIIQGYVKFAYWSKTDRADAITTVKNFLEKTENRLHS